MKIINTGYQSLYMAIDIYIVNYFHSTLNDVKIQEFHQDIH